MSRRRKGRPRRSGQHIFARISQWADLGRTLRCTRLFTDTVSLHQARPKCAAMRTDLIFFATDVVSLALSSLTSLLLLLAPGALIAKGLQRIDAETDWRAFSPALAVAFLPLLDTFTIRIADAPGGLAGRLILMCATLLWARNYIVRIGWPAIGGAVLWWLYLAVLYVDVTSDGLLHQSITVLDLVKHASVVREITQHGLPLQDPFFARSEPAGYYHYFYNGAAIVDLALGRANDARHAFVGAAFATGIAMASMLRALSSGLRWQGATERGHSIAVLLVCAIGGFDLIGIAGRWAATGLLEATSEWWDDEISFVPTAASWVPHHLSAIIASFIALFLFARALEFTRTRKMVFAILGGVAMANAFGLSVWVSLGACGVFAAAITAVPASLQGTWVRNVAIAGAVALLLSALQLSELLHNRSDGPLPIGIWVREPADLGAILGRPVPPILALIVTPLVLFLEFGAFAIGTWLFHKQGYPQQTNIFARLLIASFVAGLLMNLLLRSTIINNDFGWRVVWFAQVPAMLWTIAVLRSARLAAVWLRSLHLAIALGFLATIYNGLAARLIRPPLAARNLDYINSDPATDLALAKAYRWAALNIPINDTLQHNPASAPRIFDFGLYGIHKVAVADSEAMLFGAPREEVLARNEFYRQIFEGERNAASAGDVYLVITSRDPVWSRIKSEECVYRTPLVCITKGGQQ